MRLVSEAERTSESLFLQQSSSHQKSRLLRSHCRIGTARHVFGFVDLGGKKKRRDGLTNESRKRRVKMSKQNTLGERDFRSREKDEAREFLRLLAEVRRIATAELLQQRK